MSGDGGLRAALLRLPKAELHVHLEGSMRPSLLLELARRRGVSLPADDEAGLRRWFRFRDFEHFVEIYLTCSSCLREPEDFQRLLRDFARGQAAQKVVYSEVHFTVATHLRRGLPGDEIAEALGRTVVEIERDLGVAVRLVPDIVRNLPPTAADRTVEWALANRRRGVVALGMGGIERHSAAPFGAHFAAARDGGLGTTAHAGEQCGPAAVREVLEVCRPARLGHGVRAVEDDALLAQLAATAIPLEVCPTSNLRLGHVDRLEDHPFGRLAAAGVELSVNTDDPSLFGTSLVDEYRGVAEAFGYSLPQLARFARSAFEHAFLSEEDRDGYLELFDRELAGWEQETERSIAKEP